MRRLIRIYTVYTLFFFFFFFVFLISICNSGHVPILKMTESISVFRGEIVDTVSSLAYVSQTGTQRQNSVDSTLVQCRNVESTLN